jgi:hypothetical protein
MYARRVVPAEERLARGVLPFHVVDGGPGGFVVNCFHPLLGERSAVLDGLHADLAEPRVDGRVVGVGRLALEYAARAELGPVGRILRVIRQLWFFFGIEVVEVAEELVEAVDRGQTFVAIADVILAELTRRVTQILEQTADRRIKLAHAHRRAGKADFGHAAANAMLAREKGGPTGRAGLLCVILQKPQPLFGNAIDVGRFVAHQGVAVAADIGDPDIVAEDHQDVRLGLALRHHFIRQSRREEHVADRGVRAAGPICHRMLCVRLRNLRNHIGRCRFPGRGVLGGDGSRRGG